jgi:hypothetical protein
MNYATYFQQIHEGTTYKSYTDEKFRHNVIGVFRIVFDINKDDIIDEESDLHRTYSSQIGMRSLGIGNLDHRCPIKGNVSLNAYFYMIYKGRKFLIDLRLTNWNTKPTLQDYEAMNKGQELKNYPIQKNPWDFNKPMTATGHVSIDDKYYDVNTDKMQKDQHVLGDVNDYPSQFEFNDLQQLAQKVKSIIDGHDRRRTNKQPKKPITSNPAPKEPFNPKILQRH